MKRPNKGKKSVKLKLIPGTGESGSYSPRWSLISEREFTDKEKQKIKDIVGNVIFPNEEESTLFDQKLEFDNQIFPKKNIEDTQLSIEGDIYKDCYFPDDGYDYEQHLYTINKKVSIFQSPSNQSNSGSKISEILNSTCILNSPESTTNNPEILNELNELINCLEEPEQFEELNDDFILDVNGLKDIKEIDENINIDEILWGNNKMSQGNIEPSICKPYFKNKTEFNSQEITDLLQATEDIEIYDDQFNHILDEYNDSDSNSKEKDSICSSRDKRMIKYGANSGRDKNNIINYEDILNEYIEQARNNCISKSKLEKNLVEMNKPLEKVEIEKVISIINNIDIDETVSEETELSSSDVEIENTCRETFSEDSSIENRPQKLEISKCYAELEQFIHKNNPIPKKSKSTQYSNVQENIDRYKSTTSVFSFCPQRKKNETAHERKERKNAIKQAKRELREMKRKNRSETKELRSKLAKDFTNMNHYDVKSGVRCFKF